MGGGHGAEAAALWAGRPQRLLLWRLSGPIDGEQIVSGCPDPNRPMTERSRAVTFTSWEAPPSSSTFQPIELRLGNSEHWTVSGTAEGRTQ